MKQLNHEFNWHQVLACLINEHSHKIEDGFWQLGIKSKHYQPFVHDQEDDMSCPSNITRHVGVVLTKVDGWKDNTVHVEKGVILYGPNTDNNRLIEDGQRSGEDS